MRACIYTAIYGGYDALKLQPRQTVDTDFICFTDEPGERVRKGWRVIVDGRMRRKPPRLRAKYFKVRNDRIFTGFRRILNRLPKYDVTIWVDGSIQIISARFVAEFVEAAGRYGHAMFIHPDRDCIYDEVVAAEPMPKNSGMPLRAQAASYRRRGHPEHAGLMACGVILRMMDRPGLRTIDRDWWREILAWSHRDQISLPVVLRERSSWYDEVRLNLRDNHLLRVSPHLASN